MKTETFDIEPQWSNMAEYLSAADKNKRETLQPILNLFQGYRDFIKRKDSEYSKAFLKSLIDSGFHIEDMEVKFK